MSLNQKFILFSVASALFASAMTAAVVKTTFAADGGQEAAQQSGSLYTVSSRLPGDNTDFTGAAASTIDGVVSIKNYVTPQQRGGWGMDPFEFFFGGPRQQTPQRSGDESDQVERGMGSGVIISSDGYIITNNHVIDGAERLEVTLNDNRTFNAVKVGEDEATDLALLKIDASGLPIIPMGDSDNLKVGEWVLAVGNPFGFTSTVTTGIVSAKARSIKDGHSNRKMGIESYIQTDAAVNPGNSGGALVNLAGELVGITTAIYSQTGNYSGCSFAIPTSIIKKVTSDIREFGTVQRAVLGISAGDLTPKLAKENDITAVTQGVYVGSVSDRSSAMEAGLQKGDVITAVGGQPTNTMAQLQEQMAKYHPGDKVQITYYRDNKKKTVEVKLLNTQGTASMTHRGSIEDLGVAFKKCGAEQLKQLGLSSGVEVADVDEGRFADAGVKRGFVIYSVNDQKVSSPDDIEKIYEQIMKSDVTDKVMFLRGLTPMGQRRYYAVDLATE